MPIKNETGRFLDACLTHAMGFVDGLAVYDDRSDDDSAAVAKSHGAQVQVRPESVPSFLEHEGQFRQGAWEHFENTLHPESGDVCLALDADEFLVADVSNIADTICGVAAQAAAVGVPAITLRVPEVFDAKLDEQSGLFVKPSVRIDGFWGGIVGTRLFMYQPNGVFQNKPMGCGAEPTYVTARNWVYPGTGLHLMHLGYALPEDRVIKYVRYTSLANHGHAGSHVESIVQSPVLSEWAGPWPTVWKGTRT